MSNEYEKFKEKAYLALRNLSRECPAFEDAEMLVGSADSNVSLFKQDVYKSIDTEWVDEIEKALPALDIIVRNPTITIEDTDEILPVELSRHITEKSIKHLAQHTNLILDVKKNGDVVPQKILNVYHDESLLTYENKFINTLLARLSAFVDKRYRALAGSLGIERNYKFDYVTEFEHFLPDDEGKNLAKIRLNIELTSPLKDDSTTNAEVRAQYVQALERIKRINTALISYRSSAFAQALGRNFIRPPVVRTNGILKNKNFKECLTLWEYIESFDRVGYYIRVDGAKEMPSARYIGDLYSSVALQYASFYYSVVDSADVRMLSEKHLFDVDPEFDTEFDEEELKDYQVFDSEYKKMVPVSRLMNNRKKLSEDEKRIHRALTVALKADEIINAEMRAAEEEMRRLAKQRKKEEEERRRAEEAERERLAALLASSPIAVRYRRSFLSRYIQSGETLQSYYGRLKNQLLGYEGVKSRVSWKADRFSKGRQTLARMDVRGKRLYLYLALDPADYEGSKYRFKNVSDKHEDTPFLVKIKGKLGILHATRLVEELAKKFNLKAIERQDEDYSMAYEDDQALIGKDLIRIIFPKGVVMQDGQVLTKENLRDLFAGRLKKEDLQPLMEAPQEEPAQEQLPETVKLRYRRSFLSRYIQSGEVLQEYYGRLKNQLLGYKEVKSRVSWKADRFSKGRRTVARMDVRGKRLYLYLALPISEYEGGKYRFIDVSEKFEDTPMLLKIKGRLGILHATQLVEALAKRLALTSTDRAAEDYATPYEDNEALIAKGLIKTVYPKGYVQSDNQILTRDNLRDLFAAVEKSLTASTAEESVESQAEPPQEITAEIQAEPPVAEEENQETFDAPESEEARKAIELPEEALQEVAIAAETVKVHYRTSFLSRYIQSGETLQGYYGQIKNKLLGYKGVKSRISFKADKFNKGRQTFARMDTRGTRLYLYLALDPTAYEGGKYRFTDVSEKFDDTPMLLKIKGKLGISHAIELIEDMAQKFDLTAFERQEEDYSLPYEDNEALIAKGLIKTIYPQGYEPSEGQIFEKVTYTSALQAQSQPEEISQAPEEVEARTFVEERNAEEIETVEVAAEVPSEAVVDAEAVETVEETPTEEVAATQTEPLQEIEMPEEKAEEPILMGREEFLIEGDQELEAFLEENLEKEEEIDENSTAEGRHALLREALLSGDGVTAVKNRRAEEFFVDGKRIARLVKKFKRSDLYLALEPDDFASGGYTISKASGKYADTPMRLKVKEASTMQWATALIDIAIERA